MRPLLQIHLENHHQAGHHCPLLHDPHHHHLDAKINPHRQVSVPYAIIRKLLSLQYLVIHPHPQDQNDQEKRGSFPMLVVGPACAAYPAV